MKINPLRLKTNLQTEVSWFNFYPLIICLLSPGYNLIILKPTANWSPYIFTLVQEVKRRVYKIHVFLK